jgi:hypothetical protein
MDGNVVEGAKKSMCSLPWPIVWYSFRAVCHRESSILFAAHGSYGLCACDGPHSGGFRMHSRFYIDIPALVNHPQKSIAEYSVGLFESLHLTQPSHTREVERLVVMITAAIPM